MGQLAPAEAKNCSLLILAYLLLLFGNRKGKLTSFELFTNTEYVEFEEGTPNPKKKN